MPGSPPLRSMWAGFAVSGGGHMGRCYCEMVWSFMTLVLVVVACNVVILLLRLEGVYIPVVGPHQGAKKAKQ